MLRHDKSASTACVSVYRSPCIREPKDTSGEKANRQVSKGPAVRRRALSNLRPLSLLGSVLIGCVVLLAVLLAWPVCCLVIIDESGRTAFRRPVLVGEEITVGYIHSVEKTPVFSYFQVTEANQLKLERVRFRSFGAGMPDSAPRVLHDQGWIIYAGFDQVHTSMLWNVRTELDHTLSWRGHTYQIGDFVRNGSNVQLRVRFQLLGALLYN